MTIVADIPAIFVGRQPICNPDHHVVAYELLFRGNAENRADFVDGDAATAEVILNSFAEIGLDRVTDGLPAFINVSRHFLLQRHAYSLPKSRVVLEVLEDVEPDPEVLEALAELRTDGYSIAIDDFVYRSELLPLVDLADIVKVEFPATAPEELAEHVAILRERNVRILAEKLETHEEFDRCNAIGFDYFQGYFFSKPKVIQGQRIPINRLAILRLIARLQSDSVSTGDIVEAVRTEPSLSYKLLRFVNSSYCALSTRVESMQHAVTLVGMRRIKTFCSLSLLTKVTSHTSMQLVQMSLSRARMCDLLSVSLHCPEMRDRMFLVGLFSLDALLGKPLKESLQLVPLSDDIKNAILKNDGIMGDVLHCVLEYEKGNWDNVVCRGLDVGAIRTAYLDAINWSARAATEAMSGFRERSCIDN